MSNRACATCGQRCGKYLYCEECEAEHREQDAQENIATGN